MSKVYADLDEIVFEGREKDYGAYQNRKRYNKHLERAALIASIIFLLATGGPKIYTWILPEGFWDEEMLDLTPVTLSDIPPPPSLEEEPPPPPPDVKIPPPQRATIEFKVPTPTPDDEVDPEETIAAEEDLKDIDPGLETQEGDPNAEYNFEDMEENTGPVEIVEEEKEVGPGDFVAVDKEPAAVNMDDVKKLIGYPPMAREAGIEGKVIVRILVDKAGHYAKHVVLKDPHPLLTKAVTDKLSQLSFSPGVAGGKPVKVWVSIPFDFRLQN